MKSVQSRDLWFFDAETRPNPKLVEIFQRRHKPRRPLVSRGEVDTAEHKETEEQFAERKAKAYESWWRRRMATDPDYALLVCGVLQNVSSGEQVEITTLKDMACWLRDNPGAWLVTFNGARFDIPLLIKQFIAHSQGAAMGPLYEMLEGSGGVFTRHIDLMVLLDLYRGQTSRGSSYRSLDEYLEIYTGEVKQTQGAEFFNTATPEQLLQHCKDDMRYMDALYRVFNPLIRAAVNIS